MVLQLFKLFFMKFRTAYNYVLGSSATDYSYGGDESSDMCVPDQSLSIRELYDRFAKGHSLVNVHSYDGGYPDVEPTFDDDTSFDNGYDLSQIDDVKLKNSYYYETIKEAERKRRSEQEEATQFSDEPDGESEQSEE